MPTPNAPLPLISVIVPVFNGGRDFVRCLAALRACSPTPPWELIVVDDGSTDDSVERAREAGARVLISAQSPRGPAAARNRGAAVARGELLFFLDADVLVRPDIIAGVAAIFRDNPAVDALFGSYDDRPGAANFLSQYKNLLHHYIHQTSHPEATSFWSGCGAVRRASFQRLGGFDETYVRPCIEDIELGYRLIGAGHRVLLRRDLQVTHLKRWTPLGLLRTDIRDRALPWTRLLLRSGHVPADLNLRPASRLSIACVYLLALSLLGTLLHPAALVAIPALLLALLALNAPLYAFFLRARGPRFTLAVLPWHWAYYAYSGACFAIGTLLHLSERAARRVAVRAPDHRRGVPLPRAPLAFAAARPMLTVFLVALAARTALWALVLVGYISFAPAPDSLDYEQIGRNLASYGVFSGSAGPPFEPDFQRMPLFPSLIALAYLLSPDRLGLGPPLAIAGNVLLGSLTAALLVPLGALYGGRRVGVLAGLLLAIDLWSTLYATVLLSETAFTALLVGALLALGRYGRTPRPGLAAGAGLLLGLATLTRPIGVLLGLILVPVFFLGRARQRRLPALRDAVICLSLASVVVMPWLLRARAEGGADAISTQAAINAYIDRQALFEASLGERTDSAALRAELQAEIERERSANGWTQQEQVRVMQERAARLFIAHPALYLTLQLRGMLHLLGLDALGDRRDLRGLADIVRIVGLVQLLLLYALAAFGLLALLRARWWFPVALLLLPLLYLIVLAGPEAYSRFRVPVMPAFALLAAFAPWGERAGGWARGKGRALAAITP